MFFILSSLRGPASEALYLFLFFLLLSDAESNRIRDIISHQGSRSGFAA